MKTHYYSMETTCYEKFPNLLNFLIKVVSLYVTHYFTWKFHVKAKNKHGKYDFADMVVMEARVNPM